jgi:hypothetical protein
MFRSRICALLAGTVALIGATHALGTPACLPALSLKDVQFSEMLPPTFERKWTAIVSVDASGCAANSAGHFELVFSRSKEGAPELEFREQFIWLPPSVNVGVDFWADEAVEHYWIDNVTPCACAR